MRILQSKYFSFLSSRAIVVTCMLIVHVAFATMAFAVPFNYGHISEPILSATFSTDFAALTAHRTVGGFEVNTVKLLGLDGTELDLSDTFFGTSDALIDSAMIDQDPLGTGIISAPIDSSFFPELAKGSVGLWATFTDTFDGLFAIDFISIGIETAIGRTVAFMDSNDGFGIGLPDGGFLPDVLPDSLPNPPGTGFDEAISSKSIHVEPIPEPSTIILLGGGIILLSISLRCRRILFSKPKYGICFVLMAVMSLQSISAEAAHPNAIQRKLQIARAATIVDLKWGLAMQVVYLASAAAEALCDPGLCKIDLDFRSETTASIPDTIEPDSPEGFSPIFGGIIPPTAVVDAFNDLLFAQARVAANSRAVFISASRLKMAEAAGDTAATDLQRNALARFLEETQAAYLSVSNAHALARARLLESGLPDPIITTNDFIAFLDMLRTTGFPAEEISILQSFGFSSSEIKQLLEIMLLPPIPSSDLRMSDLFADMAQLYSEEVFESCECILAIPDQVHVVGPIPNRVPVGETRSITATVQAQSLGVRGTSIMYTTLLGNINFTSEDVSSDGRLAVALTDADGVATMTFIPNTAGRVLIKVTVLGSSLAAFSFLVAQ